MSQSAPDAPVIAHFIVHGEEREQREVAEEWLRRAAETHENVLLSDGNPYRVERVELSRDGSQTHARVEVSAPQFTRAS